MKSQSKSVQNQEKMPNVPLTQKTLTYSNLKTERGEKGVGDYHGQPKPGPTPQTHHLQKKNASKEDV